ncbi:MAG: hypothetical protein AAFY29_16920 [Pseudomonadota bacterium]
MMRLFLALLAIVLLLSPLWVAALILDSSPRVIETTSLGIDDVENARKLLRENDPRRLVDGERKEVVLREREVNLVLSYLLPEGATSQVVLGPGLLVVAASSEVPASFLGSYLNVEAAFAVDHDLVEPIFISAGSLSLPGWLARTAFALGGGVLQMAVPEYNSVLESVESVSADEGMLSVTYQWRAELLRQLKSRRRNWILPAELRERVLAYYVVLAEHSRTMQPGTSLVHLIRPLFETAIIRSESGGDARLENRALILALGMAIQRMNPNRIVPEGSNPVVRIPYLPVTLRGRHDLAQHFVVSAAIAAGGGVKLADVVGVFKELSDSQGGTGFSFPDLLADRAGVVFTETATGRSARQFQRRLAVATDESTFMPSIDRLPEGLREYEFRRRYRDIDTRIYARIKDEVERRIDNLALYR